MNAEFFIDGKRYISSKRAAKLVGYTTDYVGQLARAGKVDSKMIGRSWYVAEESVLGHRKVTLDAGFPKKNPTKKASQIVVEPEQVFESTPLLSKPVEPTVDVTSESAPTESRLASDHAPLLIEPVLPYERPRSGSSTDAALPVALIAAPTESPKLAAGGSHLMLGAASAFAVIAIVVGAIGIDRTEWNPSTVASVAVSEGERSGLRSTAQEYIGYGAAAVAESVSGERDGFIATLALGFRTFVANLFGAKGETGSELAARLESEAESSDRRGDALVVIPSTGSTTTDAEVREYVKDSFSDEVEVEDRGDGTGVIRPVFKNGKGEDYMYVLVPSPKSGR